MKGNKLRRPMMVAAAAFGTGIAAAFFTGAGRGVLLGSLGLSVVWLAWNLQIKKPVPLFRCVSLFLCMFFLGGLLLQVSYHLQDPLEGSAGKFVELSGRVTGIKKSGDAFKITLKSRESLVLITYYGQLKDYRALTGKQIRAYGELSLPAPRRNPKCFDYRLYLRTMGIHVLMAGSRVEITGGQTSPVAAIRNHFAEKLEGAIGVKKSALVMGILFGDKSAVDEEQYEEFQRNGTSHILCVSGIHMGVVYGFFCFLWRGKKGALFHMGVLAFIWFYMELAGFSPSVVRAGIMIALHLFSKILHRKYDLLSAVAFTFILMLWRNPLALFHIGFQLSFLAIFSLGVVLPFLEGHMNRVFASALTIQAGLTPYIAYLFNYISLAAPVANLAILFLAGLLLPLGFILVGLSYLPGVWFDAGAAVLKQGCNAMTFFNDFTYLGGRTSFNAESPPVFLLALYYGLLFFGVSEKGRILWIRRRWRELLAGLAVIVMAAGAAAAFTNDGFSKTELVFVDVGQGDCLHIKTAEGRNYLIDGGGNHNYDTGKKILKPYLLKNGVGKIDVAFVTHLHEDHYGGIVSLAREGMVRELALYEGNEVLEKKIKQETGTRLLYLYKGEQVKLGRDVSLEILYPDRKPVKDYESLLDKQADENASSLIMKVIYKGTSILMTGDLGTEGEENLLKAYAGIPVLHCDILKIGHHGSKYSTSDAFLQAVSPKIAVFQVGKNNFGHPAPEIIEKCQNHGIIIYRNDRNGAVGIGNLADSSHLFVKKMIQ